MRATRNIAILFVGLLLTFTACASPASSLTTTQQASKQTPTPTPNQMKSVSSKDWEVLNRWLGDLYGLPPVKNTEKLKSAAVLVSGFWFKQANKAINKLEQNGIPCVVYQDH